MDTERYVKELLQEIGKLKDENMRLNIENGLLRSASEEQRRLNGELRVELGEIKRTQYTHYGLF